MTSELTDITWTMMTDAGIDVSAVNRHPAGSHYSLRSDGQVIDFGPGTTETGAPADGWDITSYDAAENETYYFADSAGDALAYVARLAGA